MKTAVVWDFLIDRGGAEREILVLAKALNADVITTHYLPDKTYEEFRKLRVLQHPLKTYPLPLLMQTEASRKFKRVDLSKYDVVISIGDWAKFVSLNKTLRGKHIHITITPPRMLTDLKQSVEKSLNPLNRAIFRTWSHFAAKRDRKAMSKIDCIVVQSKEGKQRIEKYYGKKTYPDIVYPPTELNKFREGNTKDYFLSVQRIMPEKRVDMQIEAFNKLPDKKLVIAGSVLENKKSYLEELKKKAGKNIEFRTNISNKQLADLYAHTKCVIQTSHREDFGLIPIEAMASGKPCIAVNEGGFRETITKNTGILIDKPYAVNLVRAVRNFDSYSFKKTDIRKRADMFSDRVFVEKIRNIIGEVSA